MGSQCLRTCFLFLVGLRCHWFWLTAIYQESTKRPWLLRREAWPYIFTAIFHSVLDVLQYLEHKKNVMKGEWTTEFGGFHAIQGLAVGGVSQNVSSFQVGGLSTDEPKGELIGAYRRCEEVCWRGQGRPFEGLCLSFCPSIFSNPSWRGCSDLLSPSLVFLQNQFSKLAQSSEGRRKGALSCR